MSELRQWAKQKTHRRNPWGEKLDSNGYSESLLPSDDCFICQIGGDLARHEVFGGSSRQISKATGMWVKLCPRCHARVHADENMEELLKKEAQALFEEEYSHEEFIELFRKNYL